MVNIGIQEKDRKDIAQALARVLADTTILTLKTRNFHWNVTGPFFSSLHALFQTLYEDLEDASDVIAEYIRALGIRAPGTYAEYLVLSAIKEETGLDDALDMVRRLVTDYETLIQRCIDVKEVSTQAGDSVGEDIMVERIRTLTKHAWILRAHTL